MKVWLGFIAFVLVVAVIGCGGGGGGGSAGATATATTSTTSGSTGSLYRLVAENGNGSLVDPQNLVPGQTVRFTLLAINPFTYASSNVNTGNFSTNDGNSVAGTLDRNTGQFVAKGSTNGTTYTASTIYQGATYTETYGVTPSQAVVTGQVADDNGSPVPFVNVLFFNSSGAQVGISSTDLNGTFTASVPTTAVRFNFDPNTLPLTANSNDVPHMGYYRYFTYGQGSYNPLNTNCSAPLPGLANGTLTALPSLPILAAVQTASGAANTPPAPPGCTP